MPAATVSCLPAGNPPQPIDARVGGLVVPWGKDQAREAIGEAEGTMGCGTTCAIIGRVRLEKD